MLAKPKNVGDSGIVTKFWAVWLEKSTIPGLLLPLSVVVCPLACDMVLLVLEIYTFFGQKSNPECPVNFFYVFTSNLNKKSFLLVIHRSMGVHFSTS